MNIHFNPSNTSALFLIPTFDLSEPLYVMVLQSLKSTLKTVNNSVLDTIVSESAFV